DLAAKTHVGQRVSRLGIPLAITPVAANLPKNRRVVVHRVSDTDGRSQKTAELKMDKALYIAMTGARHNMLAQTSHSNNLANLNTTGFRADLAQARSMPVYYGAGLPTRAYSLTESPTSNFEQGPMISTGNDLDIAISGVGFIAVQAPDGSEAYTRAGNL